jgi:hypothetical protein
VEYVSKCPACNFLIGAIDGSEGQWTVTQAVKVIDNIVDNTGLYYSNCPTYNNINILAVSSIGAVTQFLRNQPGKHVVLFEILMVD